MERVKPTVNICGKRTIESIFDCISRFNCGHNEILLRAYGSNISKGVEIAQTLKKHFGVKIGSSSLGSAAYNDIGIPSIEIPLCCDNETIERINANNRGAKLREFNECFINYSTYHLLFDWYLNQNKKIEIKIENKSGETRYETLLTISKKGNRVYYQLRNFEQFRAHKGKESRFLSKINSALYRSGILPPPNWKEIARKLSTHDDVILGIDTNLLYNCTISEHILPAVTLIETKEFVHTPNWILLVVPATVMHELEEAANIRFSNDGNLKYEGRMAFRALQEIVELTNDIDIPGVSLLIIGETDTSLDHKTSLNSIDENICRLGTVLDNNLKGILALNNRMNERIHELHMTINHANKNHSNASEGEAISYLKFIGYPGGKTSSGDMTIRNQFKKFLRQIDFHKGTYFLTSDKSNSALAMAEGLNPIFVGQTFVSHNKNMPINRLTYKEDGEEKNLDMNVPIGNIIYEMAVSFGKIYISYKKNQDPVGISCDWKGRTMDPWMQKQLRINNDALKKLIADYHGQLHLKTCVDIWKELISKFEDIEWSSAIEDVFENETDFKEEREATEEEKIEKENGYENKLMEVSI